MKTLILLLTLIATVSQAGTLSCTLIYAKDGDVKQTSGSIEIGEGEDGKSLELEIKDLVEARVFHGSNGKTVAFMDRIDGESNYGLTDGSLLHMTSEIADEGRVLTCTWQE